ncbi:MAG: FadL protein, partial [Bacteroidetes bacterium]|nr:FadL protein [Bacteroidota bacterium]
MKFKILIVLLLFPMGFIFAQDLTDAVRFSRQDLMGTARFSGMSGAFSSLGGDLSALKLNPAGSSIFLTNHASGTLNLNIKSNDVNFTDGFTSDNETTFDLNQAGIVFVFASNNEDATLSKYAYGFTYEQIANYDDSYVARGNNSQSIDQFFVDSANGLPLDLLTPLAGESVSDLYVFLGETEGVSAQNALLGFQSFVIDPVDPDDFNNTIYTSNMTADNVLQ